MAYDRAADGSLSYAGTYATGGLGAPTRPINALGSQGSLVLSDDGKLLFAVNAGSSEVSMFARRPARPDAARRGRLGRRPPVSVASHGDLLFVLNVGGEGNIAGFEVNPCGELVPLDGSSRRSRPRRRDPAVARRDAGSDRLLSRRRGAGRGGQGVQSAPRVPRERPRTAQRRAGHDDLQGLVPFDFAFDRRGHLIVRRSAATACRRPATRALSSYAIGPDREPRTSAIRSTPSSGRPAGSPAPLEPLCLHGQHGQQHALRAPGRRAWRADAARRRRVRLVPHPERRRSTYDDARRPVSATPSTPAPGRSRHSR